MTFCCQGKLIVSSGAMEAEKEEADIIHLSRLVIDFNRKDFGKLRSLIDAINDL